MAQKIIQEGTHKIALMTVMLLNCLPDVPLGRVVVRQTPARVFEGGDPPAASVILGEGPALLLGEGHEDDRLRVDHEHRELESVQQSHFGSQFAFWHRYSSFETHFERLKIED